MTINLTMRMSVKQTQTHTLLEIMSPNAQVSVVDAKAAVKNGL